MMISKSPKLDRAVQNLRTLLSGGPILAADAIAQCQAQGLGMFHIRQARRQLGVRVRRCAPADGQYPADGICRMPWEWSLPHQVEKSTMYVAEEQDEKSERTPAQNYVHATLVFREDASTPAAAMLEAFRTWQAERALSNLMISWREVVDELQAHGCSSKNLQWSGVATRKDNPDAP